MFTYAIKGVLCSHVIASPGCALGCDKSALSVLRLPPTSDVLSGHTEIMEVTRART